MSIMWSSLSLPCQALTKLSNVVLHWKFVETPFDIQTVGAGNYRPIKYITMIKCTKHSITNYTEQSPL